MIGFRRSIHSCYAYSPETCQDGQVLAQMEGSRPPLCRRTQRAQGPGFKQPRCLTRHRISKKGRMGKESVSGLLLPAQRAARTSCLDCTRAHSVLAEQRALGDNPQRAACYCTCLNQGGQTVPKSWEPKQQKTKDHIF